MIKPYIFLGKLLLVFSPLILCIFVFEVKLWKGGETWPIAYVINIIKKNNDILFLRKYFDQGLYRFKYCAIKDLDPEIISIGTSRVMQFRSMMFRSDRSFFNAGGMIQHIKDLEDFSNSLKKGSRLRFLILGVEFWWLNENFSKFAEKERSLNDSKDNDGVFDGFAHVDLLRRYFRSILNINGDKILYEDFKELNIKNYEDPEILKIGLLATTTGSGFRNDGSFYYGNYSLSHDTFVDREKVVDRILNNEWKAVHDIGISDRQIQRLIDSIQRIREKNVEVVVFLPPFSKEAVKNLRESSQYRKLWSEYRIDLPRQLAKKKIMIVDGTDIESFGFNDSCMIDGLHANESYHIALLIKMHKEFPDIFSTLVDINYLTKLLKILN